MNRPATSPVEHVALASAIDAMGSDGAVKTDFLIMPFGNPFSGRDGRQWILRDQAHAEKVLAQTASYFGNAEMALNYDHQPELAVSSGAGGKAPASGWVKRLYVGDAGIHAQVEWTPPALAALQAREYRYVSPSFMAPHKGPVSRINNIALTNNPNLDLPALNHTQNPEPNGDVADMTKITLAAAALCAALGLASADGLDEDKVLATIAALKADALALNAVRAKLKLADGSDEATVLASLDAAGSASAPDPSQFVPKAGYDELAAKVARIEHDRVLASVDAGVAAGKVAPSMKEWAIELGKKDEAALNSFLAGAPALVSSGVTVTGQPGPEKGKLNADELAMCAATGVTEAEYLSIRDGENV